MDKGKRLTNNMAKSSKNVRMSASGIYKSFKNGDGVLPVLENISFSINEGEVLAIVGPSGCGKTTFLHIIGGLQMPTKGKVLLDGKELKRPSEKISYVFQGDSLFPWKNTVGNITFALEAQGLKKKEARKQAQKYINMVGLVGFEDYYPIQLSGGMKQRVALARALSTEPEIMLMDEPMASLDADLRENLQEEIANIQYRLKRTIILVSHDVEEIVFLANRIIVLSKRPAKIKEIFSIDLPQLRNANIRATEKFINLKTQIWKVLRDLNSTNNSSQNKNDQ